jgi:hypothetical protein
MDTRYLQSRRLVNDVARRAVQAGNIEFGSTLLHESPDMISHLCK